MRQSDGKNGLEIMLTSLVQLAELPDKIIRTLAAVKVPLPDCTGQFGVEMAKEIMRDKRAGLKNQGESKSVFWQIGENPLHS